MIREFVLSAGNWSNIPLNFFELSQKMSNFPKTNHSQFTINQTITEIPGENSPIGSEEDHTNNTGNNISFNKELLLELQNRIEKEATNVHNLQDLFNVINSYSGKIILDGSLNTVFHDGPINSDIMIIGEAPGANEDEKLLPFVGEAGILLNKMLNYIDIQRNDVYITNVVYWRPEKNRTPNPTEIKVLRPFLVRHVNIKKPKIILLLGNVASSCLLDSGLNLNKLRGTVHYFLTENQKKIPTIVSFHPAFLKRFPSFISEAKKDMDFFKITLDKIKNSIQ